MTARPQWPTRAVPRAGPLACTARIGARTIAVALACAVNLIVISAAADTASPARVAFPADRTATPVGPLLEEALRDNPEIASARAESDAARQRIAPAAALDDPMLEVGLVNAPVPFSLHREDMTMRMLGLSQKLPFPGKRDLRRDVASAEWTSISHAVDETINRVARDVRVTYEELRRVIAARRLVTETVETLEQLVAVAQARYAVGKANQSDALQAQIQVVRTQQELLRLNQEEVSRRCELQRLLGRAEGDQAPIEPSEATLLPSPVAPESLQSQALERRPQLKSLAALLDKSEHELELARRDYYPDFELRFSYGQRDRAIDGTPRDDMVTFTVAVNLPLWRKSRLEPRVAEASALRRRAASMAESQRLEISAEIQRELATQRQQRESADLYRTTLVPQTAAAFESALSGYRVGRGEFTTLLEARMRVYETELGEVEAVASHNKAVAEIDFLTGRTPGIASVESQQP